MHKVVLLLTKAEDADEAQDKVENFLEQYGDGDVWDWYAIGGRWSNMLAPKELADKFNKWAKEFLFDKQEDKEHIWQKTVKKYQPALQDKWKELGLKGNNPYSDHYVLPKSGDYYDIIPLSECVEKVKEFCLDLKVEMETVWNKMLEAKEEVKEGKYDMSGYFAGIYYDYNYGNFSFNTNVYEIDGYNAETVPDDVEGWWVVVVDMHN